MLCEALNNTIMNGYYTTTNNFIPVKCFTNIDDVKCGITKMVGMPIIGNKVNVLHKGMGGQTLTIVDITHCEDKDGNPYLEIELNRK